MTAEARAEVERAAAASEAARIAAAAAAEAARAARETAQPLIAAGAPGGTL
ncbi:hypothetical protein [Streptomyces sp. 1114.5]|uniref:hypothetical protein n=1 Tax=Streptomyces sp. 1114.5 TaxID=1938830 RepID=UPI00160040BB|nr:hypothetical protein [Streptomyces sp. 1114.5]